MFSRISDALRRFMYGRNGVDTLSWVLMIASVIVNFLVSLTGIAVLTFFSYFLMIYALFRVFSRNLERRQAENLRFTQFFSRLKGRKSYRYFSCPACKTMVRVPKGKGKIRITCPSCREAFVKKT